MIPSRESKKKKKKSPLVYNITEILPSVYYHLIPQLAFYVNLHRAVIGPSATLTGRWRPDIDLRRMLTRTYLMPSSLYIYWYLYHLFNLYYLLDKFSWWQTADITKTCLFKYTENFTSKNLKFSDKKIWYFSNFCSKHRLWVLVRTASARRF